jgi:hypothetical protein
MNSQRRSLNEKPKIGKCLSFSISNDKSFLDILDSVEEIDKNGTLLENSRLNNNKCNCCDRVIFNKVLLDEHQPKCFQKKVSSMTREISSMNETIEELSDKKNIKINIMREDIRHEMHIKGLEFLIERNNEKWNRIMK